MLWYLWKLCLQSCIRFDLLYFLIFGVLSSPFSSLFILLSMIFFLTHPETLSNPRYWSFATLVCFFNSQLNSEYSNHMIVAAFSKRPFSNKIFLPIKNSYFPTFSDDKAEILAVCLSKLYFALFSSNFLLVTLIF